MSSRYVPAGKPNERSEKSNGIKSRSFLSRYINSSDFNLFTLSLVYSVSDVLLPFIAHLATVSQL